METKESLEKSSDGSVSSKKQPSLLEDILSLVIKLGVIIALFILLFTFVFGFVRVADNGMNNSVKDGDLLVYYRLDKNFQAGDVAVFKEKDQTISRRVVAIDGDTVNISQQGLLVNGHPQAGLEDQYVRGDTTHFREGITLPVTLKKGEIFVMNDNRGNADDSRIFGPIKADETNGKLMLVIRRRNF